MLQELYTNVMNKLSSETIMTAAENSLSKKAKAILADGCTKYNDLASVDKISSLQGKVDVAQRVMEQNISKVLENTVVAESVAEKSVQAMEQAAVFRDKSNVLRKQMAWKNLKWNLLVGGIAIIIVVSVLTPVIRRVRN